MPEIKKILVANRGEIALRVIRSCIEAGKETVAVYSEPDAEAPYVLMADESVGIGPAASSESYLVFDKIIDAAKSTGADAIHPGYGFLSENADFAERCKEEGINFIGPEPYAIRKMGDKTEARELMSKANVPFPPGTKKELESIEDAEKIAEEIGYPVLVKAAAGGGGKGMRIIDNKDEFRSGIKAAKSEARNSFGDDRVYIEKYLVEPRHVEFQIIADTHGNVLHLFDRECSIQRRHQKVIEEAPCTILTDELRAEMAEAAISAAKACDYVGAGTIEFLVDRDRNFYFLEMNTRLQVEHPVTELITGQDLVALQILVAEGEKLPFTQDDLSMNGHAIECRIYAEDPRDNFLPSTGTLSKHRIPSGNGVRVDSGVEEGQPVTINYDPMISKLCTYGKNREQAIQRMIRALSEYEIAGCRTTIPFCDYVMKHEAFRTGEYDTHFVKDHFKPEDLDVLADVDDGYRRLAAVLLKEQGEKEDNPQQAVSSNGSFHNSDWWMNRR
ncbi:acetyl-CoA carboxylase biotin carboxylase subunit [Balneolaceae bacterium YR4-1]|uniref:Acetyl-CoA carboxylase biotin carboxylase subunit n=1 Tax=Halalkalibaculum roseum TaxID=2709311 RepID=A0A6M1SXD4_9BACT|nr:acetyl-CoA carboxylase biotin carboxylase subunit [Halalkalibaculum roseum]NGP76646.1 acetyl-CoA carboxylase biotin carboxylase subunit [Halalkalibaculum roseum]